MLTRNADEGGQFCQLQRELDPTGIRAHRSPYSHFLEHLGNVRENILKE